VRARSCPPTLGAPTSPSSRGLARGTLWRLRIAIAAKKIHTMTHLWHHGAAAAQPCFFYEHPKKHLSRSGGKHSDYFSGVLLAKHPKLPMLLCVACPCPPPPSPVPLPPRAVVVGVDSEQGEERATKSRLVGAEAEHQRLDALLRRRRRLLGEPAVRGGGAVVRRRGAVLLFVREDAWGSGIAVVAQ